MSDEEAKRLKVQLDGVMLENAGNSTWMTDAGTFDVLADLKYSFGRSIPYEELVARFSVLRGNRLVVHVASFGDVIAAKTFANRERDRETFPELLEIQSLRREIVTVVWALMQDRNAWCTSFARPTRNAHVTRVQDALFPPVRFR